MFLKKNNKKLFGGKILPNCEYCFHGAKKDCETLCTLSLKLEEGKCKKFYYNPLLRIPHEPPTIDDGIFKKEDFSI